MRERWGSGRGFLLATLGSAVGLGKVWRFSYVAGENGGGAFLLVYLVMVFLVGVPLLLGEFALGCNTQRESAAAFKAMAPTSPWRHLGLLGVIVASLILGYCALIAGWVLKYLLLHLLGATQEFAAAGFSAAFRGSIAHPLEPIAWQFSVMVLTVAAVGDTLFAVMAGLVIFPAVFSFGLDPVQGPALAFVVLPEVFFQMRGGALVGAAFFVLLSIAALTSAVSLLEVPVAEGGLSVTRTVRRPCQHRIPELLLNEGLGFRPAIELVPVTQRRATHKARAIWRRVDRAQGQGAEGPASYSPWLAQRRAI